MDYSYVSNDANGDVFDTPTTATRKRPRPGGMTPTPPQREPAQSRHSPLTPIARIDIETSYSTAEHSYDDSDRSEQQSDDTHTRSVPSTFQNIKVALKVLSQWNTYDSTHQRLINQAISDDPSLAKPIRIVSTLCHTILGARAPSSLNAESFKKISTSVEISTQLNKQLYKETCALRSQLESLRNGPTMTQPDPPQEGLNESIHAPSVSRHTKSAAPIPIKPNKKTTTPRTTDKAPKPAFEQLKPKNPSQRHHPCRLIINIQPKIAQSALPPASSVVREINNLLRSDSHDEPTPNNITVQGMLISHSANPIIITGERCTAEDLKPWYDEICAIFTKYDPSGSDIEIDRTAEATPDFQRYQVRLSQVPRCDLYGAPITPEHLGDLIKASCGEQTELDFASDPRYLVKPDAEWTSTLATVVVPLRSAKQAAMLLERKTIFIAGERCHVTRFEDRPRPNYCADCSSLEHRTNARGCPGTLCATCTDPGHTTTDHPLDISELCINCGGDHASQSRTCPNRRQKPNTPDQPAAEKGDTPPKNKPTKRRTPKYQPADKDGFSTIGDLRYVGIDKAKTSAYANAIGLGQPFTSADPLPRTTGTTKAPAHSAAAAPPTKHTQMEVDTPNNTNVANAYA